MTTNATEKTPADATNINKGNESLPKTSTHLAYMGRTSWDYDPEMDDPA